MELRRHTFRSALRLGKAQGPKPKAQTLSLRLHLHVYPALQLLAAPAAGPVVAGLARQGRARLAADARVPELVERQERDLVRPRVGPDVAGVPVRQRADLAEHLARGQ